MFTKQQKSEVSKQEQEWKETYASRAARMRYSYAENNMPTGLAFLDDALYARYDDPPEAGIVSLTEFWCRLEETKPEWRAVQSTPPDCLNRLYRVQCFLKERKWSEACYEMQDVILCARAELPPNYDILNWSTMSKIHHVLKESFIDAIYNFHSDDAAANV